MNINMNIDMKRLKNGEIFSLKPNNKILGKLVGNKQDVNLTNCFDLFRTEKISNLDLFFENFMD